jgi:predicted dithiol-disulfide oxidoreductase (DUF899 family)
LQANLGCHIGGNFGFERGKKTYYFEGGMGPNFAEYFGGKKTLLVYTYLFTLIVLEAISLLKHSQIFSWNQAISLLKHSQNCSLAMSIVSCSQKPLAPDEV